MPAHRRHTWWGVAAAALLATACSNKTTSPKLNDPAQLNSDLQTVNAVFQTGIFESFSNVIGAPGTAAPASPLGAVLLRATAPTTLGATARRYVASPARLAALRQVALALSPALSSGATMLSVIPDTLKGKTFVWNPDSAKYLIDPARTDADPNGVRFELYALGLDGLPAGNPPTVVGELDLIDKSTTDSYKLQVVLTGTGASPTTYADYTITATTQGNPVTFFQATAVGFVTDGIHRLDFNATFTVTNPSSETPNITVNVTWTLNDPALSLAVNESVTWQDASHVTLSLSNSIAHTQTVALGGTVGVTIGATDTTATFNLTMTVDGGVFARITGTTPNVVITPTTLNQVELQAVLNMYALASEVEAVIEYLFHPVEHFVV